LSDQKRLEELKLKYNELEDKWKQAMKEQDDVLKEMQAVCPHDKTTPEFEDYASFGRVKMCETCRKMFRYDNRLGVWEG
jgi:hypothetical protein